ncbi:MAG TPA: hypothetical protein VMA36_18110 [Candidatus Limnocylindria bacterium]|nr:hypothetical protein [Candidatus Limnocylindria bacterium]
MQNRDLRPLGIGELLDRAVTLYVRRFVPILSAMAVVYVPVLVLQAVATPAALRSSEAFARLVHLGASAGGAASRPDPAGHVTAVSLVSILACLLMWNAVFTMIASEYDGVAVGLAAAYRFAVRRWFAQVGVSLAWLVIGVLGAALLLFVPVVASTMLWALGAKTVGMFLGSVTALFGIAVAAWMLMVYELSSVAILTETANVLRAVRISLGRGVARATRWRVLLGGLVFGVMLYGGILVIGTLAAVAGTATHQPVIEFALNGVGEIVTSGLVTAFVVVFAADLRVRREGLDLAARLQSSVSESPRESAPGATVSQ